MIRNKEKILEDFRPVHIHKLPSEPTNVAVYLAIVFIEIFVDIRDAVIDYVEHEKKRHY